MKTWLKRLMAIMGIISLVGLVAWVGYLFPEVARYGWTLPVGGFVIKCLLYVGHKGTER